MPATRRHLLAAGLGFAGAAMFGAPAAAASGRKLALLNLHTGERLSATYWEAGAYLPDALSAIDRILRDHRTDEVHPIDPRLLDLAAEVTGAMGSSGPIQIISGYRSPRSNAALRRSSNGVARRSLHMEGQALDIRIPGALLAQVRDTAWSLQRGGVGYYPGSDFVHVDVGRPRRWAG